MKTAPEKEICSIYKDLPQLSKNKTIGKWKREINSR